MGGRITQRKLGPLLFLAYVNDIWRNIESKLDSTQMIAYYSIGKYNVQDRKITGRSG
jgi:hypothetical protein